jgi:hypothetical protein
MKKITLLMTTTFLALVANAQTHELPLNMVCVAEIASGVQYDENSKQWISTRFKVDLDTNFTIFVDSYDNLKGTNKTLCDSKISTSSESKQAFQGQNPVQFCAIQKYMLDTKHEGFAEICAYKQYGNQKYFGCNNLSINLTSGDFLESDAPTISLHLKLGGVRKGRCSSLPK